MSFISKDHFDMALKGVRRLIDQASKNISQSDWNETDKNSNAYILNKPFEENGLEYVFVDLEHAPASGQEAATLSNTCEYELIPGNMYKVIINGIEKEVECIVFDDSPESRYLMLDETSTRDYNTIFQYTGRIYQILSFTPWTNGTASVKVIGRTQPAKKLSEQYIPSTIARVSDIAKNIESSVNTKIGNIFYGSCSTGGLTSTKVATVNSNNGLPFSLKDGVMICINFTEANKINPITLNVNSTGAKSIRLGDSTMATSQLLFWQSYSLVTFLYNSDYWNIVSISPSIASTTNYGLTKLSPSTSYSSVTTAATSSAVKSAYDLANQAYNLASAALPKTGGTLTGLLTLGGDPTLNLHAATKQYVDNAIQQSDWNQDNEAAIDFIKNKPFGLRSRTLVVPAFNDDYGMITDLEFAKLLWEKKEIAKYTYTRWSNLAVNHTYEQFEQTSDVEITIPFSDRFFIVSVNIETGLIKASIRGNGFSHATISIPEVLTIDDKFIPDSIARKADIPVVPVTSVNGMTGDVIIEAGSGGVSSWNDLTDKPFDYIKTSTLLEKNVTLAAPDGAPFAFAEMTDVVSLEVGKTYTVSLNGEDYICIGRSFAGEMVILGNLSILGYDGSNDTGEPFLFVPVGMTEIEGCTICGKEAITTDFGLYEIEVTKTISAELIHGLPIGLPEIITEDQLGCVLVSTISQETDMPVWEAVPVSAVIGEVDVLPEVTPENNGQILGVTGGAWGVMDAPSGLPEVSSTDNGKVLTVTDGVWVANEIAVTSVNGQTGDVQIDALPNPNTITFTGVVEAIYDGSSAVSVEIPSGLPEVTAENEGAFLRIINGVPTWVVLEVAEEGVY